MNRKAIATSFAVSCLTLLTLLAVNRFGYSSVKAAIVLVVIAVLAAFTAGISGALAIGVAFVIFYVLDYFLNDRFTAVVILAAIAVIAALAVEGKNAWRR
jgi:O-antigen ligase